MARLPWHENVTAETVARDLATIARSDSAQALGHFAHHPSQWVRRAVAAHPNVPVTVMKRLANDHHLDVLRALVVREDLPTQLRRELFEQARENAKLADTFAAAGATPPELLAEIVLSGLDTVPDFPQTAIERALRNGRLSSKHIRSEDRWEVECRLDYARQQADGFKG